MLSVIGLAFGVMLLVVAGAPTEVMAIVALVFMGVCSISFISTANATIQLRADPAMRGRVMALYAIAFLGSTPIGAPLVGWIADVTQPTGRHHGRWSGHAGRLLSPSPCATATLAAHRRQARSRWSCRTPSPAKWSTSPPARSWRAASARTTAASSGASAPPEVSQLSRLATTLMARATITAPKRYDTRAWERAIRRTGFVVRFVSETWKVMPTVKAR